MRLTMGMHACTRKAWHPSMAWVTYHYINSASHVRTHPHIRAEIDMPNAPPPPPVPEFRKSKKTKNRKKPSSPNMNKNITKNQQHNL